MAIWHYRSELVPRAGVLSRHGSVPQKILFGVLDDDCGTPEYWEGHSVLPAREIAHQALPTFKTWDIEAEVYGYRDGSTIEISEDGISASIDCRKLERDVICSYLEIAKELNCLIVTLFSGSVIEPSHDSLAAEIQRSRAFLYLQDPRSALEQLSRGPGDASEE